MGLGDPLEVASQPLLVRIQGSIMFTFIYNPDFTVSGHVETGYDIYSIIQEACYDLNATNRTLGDPWTLLQSPSWSIFRRL